MNRIILNNFKCFENINIALSNLNVFAGINSMGKSTVIQAFLLLRQSYDIGALKSGLHLNGNLISLGTGRDLMYRDSENEDITILIVDQDETYSWTYEYERDSDYLVLKNAYQMEYSTQSNLFQPGFTYVCADRLGPQKIYEKSYHQVVDKKQIGIRGEGFVDFLSEFGEMMTVKNEKVLFPNISRNLLSQMQAWLSEISPGITLDTMLYREAGLVSISFSREKYSPLNVGFGLSYVAPVILSILKAKKDDLLILENPEAHLHPKGQRRIGEMIAAASSGGVQIILETHSDHILNGIRLAVKKGVIDSKLIRLNYFFMEEQNGKIRHQKCSPQILPDGSLSDWPDGFFDEWDKAIDDLFRR